MSADGACSNPAGVLDAAASAKTLGALRMDAIHGLLALPRVGVGIGGFLLGVPGPKPRIRESIEIPCSHARGPAFFLTPEEIDYAGQLKSAVTKYRVLGMYVSKTRGSAELAAPDFVLFDAVCPETGQIMLVIRPSTVEPVRAVLFARDESNSVRLECDWELRPPTPEEMDYEPEPEPEIERPAMQANAAVIAMKAAAASLSEPAPVVREILAAPPVDDETEPAIPAAMPQSAALFRGAESARRRGIPEKLAYAAVVTALIAAAIAAMARSHGGALPALALDVANDNGEVVFHWNREAVAGADGGTLIVNDAGRLLEFPLSGARLASGAFRYRGKSDRIVARLAVGGREARAVFFGDGETP